MITNPLNSSSKKEMKHNVYIKSIYPSILKYVQSYGMKVGDIIETIYVDGPKSYDFEVTYLDDATKSILNSERPITLTCCSKIYNEKYLEYWKWRIRKDTNENGELCLAAQDITDNDIVAIGDALMYLVVPLSCTKNLSVAATVILVPSVPESMSIALPASL